MSLTNEFASDIAEVIDDQPATLTYNGVDYQCMKGQANEANTFEGMEVEEGIELSLLMTAVDASAIPQKAHVVADDGKTYRVHSKRPDHAGAGVVVNLASPTK